MRAITRRVDALEKAAVGPHGWDISKPVHAIIMDEETPHAEALAEYMAKNPDVAVESDHNVIWWVLVSPKRDEQGNWIHRDPDQRGNDGPTLGEVLAQIGGNE